MRKQLANINGDRKTFEGVFVRFGTKNAYKGYPIPTLLLKDIKDASKGIIVADHLWFTVGKRLSKIQFQEGDIIRFDARVTPYIKGYRGGRDDYDLPPIEQDFRLSFPTKITKVSVEISIGNTLVGIDSTT